MKKTRLFLVGAIVALVVSFSSGVSRAEGGSWKELTDQALKLYHEQRYEKAAEVTKEAWESARKQYGPESLEVAESMGSLVALYDIQGIKEKQKNCLLVQSWEIRRKLKMPCFPQRLEKAELMDKVKKLRRCDLDADKDCDSNDLAIFDDQMGKCYAMNMDMIVAYCDMDSDMCVTEKDRDIFLQKIRQSNNK